MRLLIRAVWIISFSALPLAVALAEELSDVRMDQITAGGFFELAAEELDMATSAPVGPIRRNVIGGVGILLEEFLSEVFSSQQSLLADLGSPGTTRFSSTVSGGSGVGSTVSGGSGVGSTVTGGSGVGNTVTGGSGVGSTVTGGSGVGNTV
jgi:hypothetical protein